MKRIALIVMLALYSMGGCHHEGGRGDERHSQTVDNHPVIPAPAAFMLAALGVSIVLVGRKK